MFSNTTGSNNTSLGYKAGDVITTGSNNVVIGHNVDPSAEGATNQIVIGTGATGQADNSVVLGNADVTAVYATQDAGATLHAGALNLSGTAVTATAAELNLLDGVTALATSVNLLSDALVETNSMYIGNDPSSTTDDAQYNVAVGINELDAVTQGDQNVAVGYDALTANTTGEKNTGLGLSLIHI